MYARTHNKHTHTRARTIHTHTHTCGVQITSSTDRGSFAICVIMSEVAQVNEAYYPAVFVLDMLAVQQLPETASSS